MRTMVAAFALSLFPSAALAQLPAIIVSQPSPQTVNASQDAAFTVNATNILIGMTEEDSNGRYRIRYRWQRLPAGSNSPSDLTESGTYNGTRTATLTVKNVSSAMSGDRFQCVVSNGVDPERTSSQAELTVAGIPVPTITSP
ncbi:MAG: immunoglobulin domain-containing protein, partial [Verrucomicrobia bacterium]|nr:immunoglobulin domain-containing protein [Verrucomicrobiota bacterium]